MEICSFSEYIGVREREKFVRFWTDFGECNLAAVDFGGTLVLTICENFYSKKIIKDFIDICNEKGIHFKIEREYEYEQANLRMKKL